MVHILVQDVKEETDLLQYISSESDSDIENRADESVEHQREFTDIEPEVPLNNDFPTVIILAGLPKVGRDKYDRLKTVLRKVVTRELTNKQILNTDQTGNGDEKVEPFTIDLPIIDQQDGSESTVGFCYLSFRDSFEASNAAKCLSHTGIDNKHTFRVCRIDDFDTFLSGEYEPAAKVGFSRENQRNWLNDPLGREQFINRCGNQTSIMLHDAIERQPEYVCPHQERLGASVCWSPMGSYLVTFHKQGVWLRGDEDFNKKVSFTQDGVKHLLFSSNEEYLITWDGTNIRVDHDRAVVVWQVLTGKSLRAFPTPVYSSTGVPTEEGGAWPFYLFSHDSKYLATKRERDLMVFELPSMDILEEPKPSSSLATGSEVKRARTPLSYPLEMFQWSPSANLLSLWIPENGDAPGRLLLVDIPSRREVASKNVFNVKRVWMNWQPRGDFMALRTIIARKKGKKTKTETTQIEVFKVREKSIPVDTISVEGASVKDLFWEKGTIANRFATLDVDESTTGQTLKFYQVPIKGAKRDTELVAALPVPQNINTFEWSPAGQYFVAASKGPDGALLFGCLNDQNKVEITHKDEHLDLTNILWDPSGRYVTTAVLISPAPNSYRYGTNAGFRIYSFLGRLQYRFTNEKCQQFLWRPRPPSLLPPRQIEEVHRKLKEYSKKYDAQDDARRLARKQALKEESRGKMNEFMNKLNTSRNILQGNSLYSEWQESWKRLDKIMRWEESVQTWDEVFDVSREAVNKKGE